MRLIYMSIYAITCDANLALSQLRPPCLLAVKSIHGLALSPLWPPCSLVARSLHGLTQPTSGLNMAQQGSNNALKNVCPPWSFAVPLPYLWRPLWGAYSGSSYSKSLCGLVIVRSGLRWKASGGVAVSMDTGSAMRW